MIRFSCPSCEAVLEAPESKGGGIMCCPECDQKMQVPDAPEKPSRRGRDDDDVEEAEDIVEDLEEVDEGDERSNGKGKSTAITSAPSKKKSAGARATDNDEDDDSAEDDEEEVRPKKKKRKAEEGSGSTLVVLLIVLGVVALAGAGVGVYMLTSKDDGKVANRSSSSSVTPPPPASSAINSSVDSGSSSIPSSSSGYDPGSSAGSSKEPDPLNPVVDTGNRGPMVYERLKKSTVLIYVWTQTSGNFPGQSGSGFVIDRKNRLVLTNYHVIEGGTKSVVLFPEIDKGQMVSEKKYYQTKAISGAIPASTVVVKDERRDLALIQLAQPVPQGTLGLRPAEKEPLSGAKVYSVGSPGASGGAFVFTGGDVKSVYQKKWKVSLGGSKILDLQARVVETTSPTNHGDSGGPLANDDGEFVGVTEGGSADANNVSFFIATSEVKSFLSENLPKLNPPVTWEVEKEGGLEPVGTGTFTARSLEGLKRVLKEPDARRRAEAARAIGTIPANDARSAIPDLLDAVKDEDDNVSRRAQESLTKIGGASKFEVDILVKKYLTDSNARVKLYAIQAIAPTGVDGAAACDVLIGLTKDGSPEIRREALFALGKVGIGDREKVFPVLFGQLKESKDAQTRHMLGQALASLGPLTGAEVILLKDNLAHPVSEVRVYCAKSLGQLGPAAKVAVPALKDDLKSDDQVTAIAAAEALGKIGPEAKEAKPALLEMLQSKEPALSKVAAEALVQIKDINKGDVDTLKTALKTGSTHVKVASLVILGSSGLEAKDVLDPINAALKDPDKAVRVQAMKSLASFASGSPDAVGKLIQAAKDQDNEIRVGAVRALVKVGPSAGKDAVRALDHIIHEDAQKDKNFDVEFAKEIVVALGEMKLEGKKDEYQEIYKLEVNVCTHLVDLLELDRYAPLAEAIGTSIGKIGTASLAPPAFGKSSSIERLLASPIALRRYYGAVALNEIAPELKKADPQFRLRLVKTLDDLIMKEAQKPDADPRTRPMLEQARDKIKTDV